MTGDDSTASSPALIEARAVWKEFSEPEQEVVALRDVSLRVEAGEFLTITGPSGSGKSTLLSLLGALDRPTRGTIELAGESLDSASPRLLARIRRERLGFVFQDFLLIRHLSAMANVRLPLLFCDGDDDLARRLVERVGLSHRAKHRPDALSRGEMQRVALARALVGRPDVLLADEPTANLDRRNSQVIWELLQELSDSDGLTVVVATHDADAVGGAGRVLRLDDGGIEADGSA